MSDFPSPQAGSPLPGATPAATATAQAAPAAAPSANAYDVLVERGYVKDVSDADGLRRALERPTTFYVGFDPTATSLHGEFATVVATDDLV